MDEHDTIVEVRNKVDIVDIIGEYIPLIQKGKNYFGVCPFHDDSHPSMSVSREKQIYTCFACGATGNVYRFLMDYEHIEFREALVLLANKAGVPLKNLSFKGKEHQYEKFYQIYDLATKYYQNNLNTSEGKEAREYLRTRNLNDDVIKEFGIGLALDQADTLTKLLIQKGSDQSLLNDIGLSSDYRDTFIKRIMFPLHDIQGHTVGFSGRIYDSSKLNKYLNTKETQIFKKGLTMYHYFKAKDIVRKSQKVIVMEGFMDVIRAYTIGISYTVALMGTALTNEQAQLLKRLSSNVILCFDGDEAGKHATLVNGEHLESIGLSPKVIALEDDYDPDTYILEFGKEKFETLIEHAIHFSDYKMKLLKEGVNFNSEEEKANYINSILKETAKIKDDIRCEIILKNLALECNIGYNTLEKRLNEYRNRTVKKEVISFSHKASKKDKYDLAMKSFLYYMMIDPKVITRYENEKIYFSLDRARILASEISYYYQKYGVITVADFYTYLTDRKELLAFLDEILALDLKQDVEPSAIDDYIQVIRENNVSQEIVRLKELMERELDPIEKAKLGEKMRMLRMGS